MRTDVSIIKGMRVFIRLLNTIYIYIYIYINEHTHTHIYIYIYAYTCIYNKRNAGIYLYDY